MAKRWMLSTTAEPIVPAWTNEHPCDVKGAELEHAILRGFSDEKNVVHGPHKELTFEKTFTFKEHGEYFRGAQAMAGLRYANDFYKLLERYGTIKVTITKRQSEED